MSSLSANIHGIDKFESSGSLDYDESAFFSGEGRVHIQHVEFLAGSV